MGEFEEEFRAAATDPSAFGPAKSILMAMQEAGVDLTDEGQVDARIEGFNARPIEGRRKVVR